ncbi:hypothetical protein GIX45_15330, partial [Erwinia sp. CPCC 100877]|nr:hypothetical protein [Erwinia sp. CPCC 100877]
GPVTGNIPDGGITDDSRPTFSGQATDDIDHVNIYDDGKLIGSAAVDSDGKWSFTPDTDLTDGEHSLTVSAVDKAGNEGSQTSGTGDGSWDFTVDTTSPDNNASGIVDGSLELIDDEGPVTGNIPDGGITDDSRPTFSGQATDDIDHVNIYDDGKLIGSAAVDSDGKWSFTPDTDLTDGEHSLTVSAVDKAGNEGPQTSGTGDGSWDFTVDTTSPDNNASGIVDGSLELIDDEGPVTGNIPDGGITDDSRPTFSGQATDDIDHVNIYDDGKLIGSAAVDSDGKWSFTPDTDLTDGEHSLTVSAVDKAGNEGPQTSGTGDGSWDFTVDTTSPDNISSGIEDGSISLTDDVEPVTGAIPDGGSTNDSRPTYSGKATDDIDHVNIYDGGELIGSAKVESDGTWSFTPDTALSSGGHGLTVAAVDAAGNEGPQVSGTGDESWDFTLLTSAPAQPSIENVSDDYTQGE